MHAAFLGISCILVALPSNRTNYGTKLYSSQSPIKCIQIMLTITYTYETVYYHSGDILSFICSHINTAFPIKIKIHKAPVFCISNCCVSLYFPFLIIDRKPWFINYLCRHLFTNIRITDLITVIPSFIGYEWHEIHRC